MASLSWDYKQSNIKPREYDFKEERRILEGFFNKSITRFMKNLNCETPKQLTDTQWQQVEEAQKVIRRVRTEEKLICGKQFEKMVRLKTAQEIVDMWYEDEILNSWYDGTLIAEFLEIAYSL